MALCLGCLIHHLEQFFTITVSLLTSFCSCHGFVHEEFYIVDEGVDSGKVRMCAEVLPPMDFDFSVNFTTTEEGSTAGNTASNF